MSQRNEQHVISESTRLKMRELAKRYPNPRSALLPMLHLVQAEQDEVTIEGMAACAEELDITSAEVTAVATFTQCISTVLLAGTTLASVSTHCVDYLVVTLCTSGLLSAWVHLITDHLLTVISGWNGLSAKRLVPMPQS